MVIYLKMIIEKVKERIVTASTTASKRETNAAMLRDKDSPYVNLCIYKAHE